MCASPASTWGLPGSSRRFTATCPDTCWDCHSGPWGAQVRRRYLTEAPSCLPSLEVFRAEAGLSGASIQMGSYPSWLLFGFGWQLDFFPDRFISGHQTLISLCWRADARAAGARGRRGAGLATLGCSPPRPGVRPRPSPCRERGPAARPARTWRPGASGGPAAQACHWGVGSGGPIGHSAERSPWNPHGSHWWIRPLQARRLRPRLQKTSMSPSKTNKR